MAQVSETHPQQAVRTTPAPFPWRTYLGSTVTHFLLISVATLFFIPFLWLVIASPWNGIS